MRGPIDYIAVAFEGNNFHGEILEELAKAVSAGAIAVLDLAVIAKNETGEVVALELSEIDDPIISAFAKDNKVYSGLISDEDTAEIGEVLANNCAAGLLVIEQLWAKPLKAAIIKAGGELLAEGRIHPEATEELSKEGK